jgi:hypothetical protein
VTEFTQQERSADASPTSHEAAIDAAMDRLNRDGDASSALEAVRVLVGAGWPRLALRVLRATELGEAPELGTLADQLASAPAGESPLSVYDDQYQRNRALLLNARPALAEALPEAWSGADRFVVIEAPTGTRHVAAVEPELIPGFVFPVEDHQRIAAGFDAGASALHDGWLLAGAPTPPMFDRLRGVRHENGYAPPIDIIEPDLDMLRIWLHLVELTEEDAAGRVTIAAGEDALERYGRICAERHWRMPPKQVIKSHRPGWTPPAIDAAVWARWESMMQARRADLLEMQNARYPEGAFESACRRLASNAGSDAPLRVVGFTSRFTTVLRHAMRDLQSAFQRAGHEFDLVMEPDASSMDVDTWSALAETRCDMIVVINHLRHEYGDRFHHSIPFACWMQDRAPGLWSEQAGQSVTARDVVITPSPRIMQDVYDYPADRLLASSNLTDPHTYSRAPADDESLEPYRCDVSFVSHASAPVELLADQLDEELQWKLDGLPLVLANMLEDQLDTLGWLTLHDRLELMLEAEEATGGARFTPQTRRDVLAPVTDRLYDRIIRHETLRWVVDWAEERGGTVRLYGRGWEDNDEFAPYAAGEIGNGEPLRLVSQASRVNLQVNGYQSLHQRLLDSVASGGFVLCRWNPADFLRAPGLRLAELLRKRRIEEYDQLLRVVDMDPDIGLAVEELRALDFYVVAPDDDPAKRRVLNLLKQCGMFPEREYSNDAIFESIVTASCVPHRCAGDIAGFERTTFDSRESCRELLDRAMGDGAFRNDVRDAMYESVAAHDTFDALVPRIIRAFAEPTEART